MELNLYSHQQKLIELNPKRHLLAHGTGTGKTITSLALTKHNNQTALIIVPKALKLSWGRHIENFNPNHLVVSKEEFRRDWDTLPKFNCIIVDEFHFFANLKSQMSKALLKYQQKHKPQYIYGLTATPFCSSPLNIFALAKHLGHNWNYWKFFNQFFYNVPMGNRLVPVQRKGIENEVADLVKEIGSVCSLEDCIDVPEQTFETVYLETTKEQEKAIKEIDDIQAIVRWTKIHQIMGGSLKGDEYTEDKIIKSNKLEVLKNLILENPRTIVVCRYNNEIEFLKTELEKILPVFIINGSVNNRDEIIQNLKGNNNYCLLVNAMCSEGWELKECPVMIFYSLSFSLKDKIQMQGRIQRIDSAKKNTYISLVVKDSIDEDVFECINRKMDFHIAVYNKDMV